MRACVYVCISTIIHKKNELVKKKPGQGCQILFCKKNRSRNITAKITTLKALSSSFILNGHFGAQQRDSEVKPLWYNKLNINGKYCLKESLKHLGFMFQPCIQKLDWLD